MPQILQTTFTEVKSCKCYPFTALIISSPCNDLTLLRASFYIDLQMTPPY